MKELQPKKVKETIFWVFLNVVGIVLYTIGIKCFAVPHKIAPGGASGIAILINYATGFPIGLFSSLFSIPLLIFILYKKYFPVNFALRAVGSILFLSVVMDISNSILPQYQGDALLAALFAGAFMGTGLACVYLGHSDTGGITLIGLIIQKKFPQFPVGGLITAMNMMVVLSSGIVFRNMESVLYAIVTVYISGIFMDKMVDNVQAKDLLIVMSECTDKVRCAFLNRKHGITVLKGEGGYTSETQRVIMGAVGKSDCAMIKKEIEAIDPRALIIIAEASKVTGKNFGHLI